MPWTTAIRPGERKAVGWPSRIEAGTARTVTSVRSLMPHTSRRLTARSARLSRTAKSSSRRKPRSSADPIRYPTPVRSCARALVRDPRVDSQRIPDHVRAGPRQLASSVSPSSAPVTVSFPPRRRPGEHPETAQEREDRRHHHARLRGEDRQVEGRVFRRGAARAPDKQADR